jgi:hypothetical protein
VIASAAIAAELNRGPPIAAEAITALTDLIVGSIATKTGDAAVSPRIE